jgi:hypothetical protein
MLTLAGILGQFGFEPDVKTKLVRHQDGRFDVARLHRAGLWQFETYQSLQSRPVFDGAKRIVSFLGQPGTTAVFAGVYDVEGVEGRGDFKLPEGFLFPEIGAKACFRYALRRDGRFEELERRLVIDWGAGTRSWVQHYRDGAKPVIEILPKGYVDEWPGFMELSLCHDELANVVSHRDAHREWHRMLASVAGVYLILDSRTGAQYVGSAYGEEGILGRWRNYATTVHGGNKKLKELAAKRPRFANDLQFAILQTMPVTSSKAEVLAHEVRHKNKLGSRAHGLNSN